MKEELQRIALAEFEGIKCQHCNNTGIRTKWGQKEYEKIRNCHPEWKKWPELEPDISCSHSEIPDYLSDLNAMHEAETVLKPEQWRVYSDKLMVLVRDSDLQLLGSNIEARYKTAHATAAQRAEALLRTIGKWVES